MILVALVAAVAITWSRGAESPGATAEEWAAAALEGDSERAAQLECGGYDGGRLAALRVTELALPSEMEAKDVEPLSSDGRPTRWSVVLGWRDIAGKEREITVEVRQEDDGYVVC